MPVTTAITGIDFNPRSHEGSDSDAPRVPFLLSDFNPRSHEGSDVRQACIVSGS